jgi:hypothetical protein
MRRPLAYWMIGFLCWIVVDYTSTFLPDKAKWVSLMPHIWLFYIGIPAVMAFVIYRLHWYGKKLFLATLMELFVAEIILFQNAQLLSFPQILLLLPIAIDLYCFLTFVPKWIVEGTIGQKRDKAALLSLGWVLFSILHFLENTH